MRTHGEFSAIAIGAYRDLFVLLLVRSPPADRSFFPLLFLPRNFSLRGDFRLDNEGDCEILLANGLPFIASKSVDTRSVSQDRSELRNYSKPQPRYSAEHNKLGKDAILNIKKIWGLLTKSREKISNTNLGLYTMAQSDPR